MRRTGPLEENGNPGPIAVIEVVAAAAAEDQSWSQFLRCWNVGSSWHHDCTSYHVADRDTTQVNFPPRGKIPSPWHNVYHIHGCCIHN